ncbi:esterase/lipase [Penicillium sp. IBT 16267x]|nr:esterase/lipase [Penicillium sp. IBT 16267x]
MSSLPRPPLHPDLTEVHNQLPKDDEIKTSEQIANRRRALDFTLEYTLRGREDAISHEESQFTGPAGPLKLSVFRPKQSKHSKASGILFIHAGGHVSGSRFVGIDSALDWVEEFGAVLVSADYRFAPEHPQPAQVEVSYAALKWMSGKSQELGFDRDQIIVCGGSAGGNLAAGVTLLARDRSGPQIRGQLLMYPWLDDSNITNSMMQFADLVPWTRSNSIDACNYALGVNREHATIYTVPSRANDLGGLPPTWIDVGDADVFRDEDVEYATKLWKAGVSTELHVWPGCWHGFDVYAPDAPTARSEWVRNLLSRYIETLEEQKMAFRKTLGRLNLKKTMEDVYSSLV